MLVGQQGVAVQARSDPPQRVVQEIARVSHRERRSSLSSCEASRFEVQQGGKTTEGGKTRRALKYGYTVRLYCTSTALLYGFTAILYGTVRLYTVYGRVPGAVHIDPIY